MTAVIAIDTNVLVGWLDERDTWHKTAAAIRDALDRAGAELIYFDCVLNETISVLARRTSEQKRPEQLDILLDQLAAQVPPQDVNWISSDTQRLYDQIVSLVRRSGGNLNFHDALMALICRAQNVSVLASFDEDFDQVNWLTRIGDVPGVSAALHPKTAGLQQ